MDGWRDPLEAATVALDLLDGSGGGTGFVLAPGTVVTCAHVVAGAATVRGRIVATGTELTLTLSEDSLHRAANGLDIAFLRFEAEAPPRRTCSPHRTPRSATACGSTAIRAATTARASGPPSSTRATPACPSTTRCRCPAASALLSVRASAAARWSTGAPAGCAGCSPAPTRRAAHTWCRSPRSSPDAPHRHRPCPGWTRSPTSSCGPAATAIPAPGCATTSPPLGTPRTSIRTPRSSPTRRTFHCRPSTSARRRRPPTRRRWTRLPRTATAAGAGHGRAPRAYFRTTATCCSPAVPEQASRASCGGWPTPEPLLGWTTRHGRRRTYPYAWRPRTPRPPLPGGAGPGGRP